MANNIKANNAPHMTSLQSEIRLERTLFAVLESVYGDSSE